MTESDKPVEDTTDREQHKDNIIQEIPQNNKSIEDVTDQEQHALVNEECEVILISSVEGAFGSDNEDNEARINQVHDDSMDMTIAESLKTGSNN